MNSGSIIAVSTAHGFVKPGQPVNLRFRDPTNCDVPILKGKVHSLDKIKDVALLRFAETKELEAQSDKYDLNLMKVELFRHPDGVETALLTQHREKSVKALFFGRNSSAFLDFRGFDDIPLVTGSPQTTRVLIFRGKCVSGDSGSPVVDLGVSTCYGIVHGILDNSRLADDPYGTEGEDPRLRMSVVVIPAWVIREVCPVPQGTLILQSMAQVHFFGHNF